MKKIITLLGSTGSIGTQTLDVVRMHGLEVYALAAYHNVSLLEQQVREFHPKKVCIFDESCYPALRDALSDLSVEILTGMDGLCELASDTHANLVLNSVVGMVGLQPTLAAIAAGIDVALANKETLVAGGELVMKAAAEKDVAILPVDSEHSAIFQCLQGNAHNPVKEILLTASGGPFYGYTREQLQTVTAADALKHPNWNMGNKVTIDSATMMNKGLELIEAVWLFGVSPHDVKIVVHRESIVHSAVEYDDNSVIAQLGLPDMRIPIQYALTYPERYESPVGELDLASLGKLTFFEPDYDTFRCINICREAIDRGGLYPAAVNGANEQANLLFRNGKIGFLDIAKKVEAILPYVPKKDVYTLDDVLEIDRFAREFVMKSV